MSHLALPLLVWPAAMRNLLALTIPSLLAACTGGPEPYHEPPVLKVTSPKRSLMQSGAGQVMVAGTVEPNYLGIPIDKVTVNGVGARVNADGTWQAQIEVPVGATLIETSARDVEGGEAFDTRAVQAGELRPVGGNISNAMAASLSAQSFQRISAAASAMIKTLDLGAMIAPLQPMQSAGGGPDCLYEQVFINDIKFSDIRLALVPADGGISFSAEIDGLDVPGSARWAVACLDGSTNLRVTADRVAVSGTLLVSPNGMQGFKTDLINQNVSLDNLQLSASGIPGTILDMINIGNSIQGIIAKGAELAMEPAMNAALGGLAGPKTLNVLGHTITMDVAPSDIFLDSAGALVSMDMSMLIGGAEQAQYVYTPNGMPTMDPTSGFQLALADDLANEMMAEAKQIGLLTIVMPASGGTFDSSKIEMTLPPMISADPKDGNMKVILGDMMVTFTSGGTPVAKAAVNAKLEVKIEPGDTQYAVAVRLGKPTIKFNTLDDIANLTTLSDSDLAKASEGALEAQIAQISALLVNIPMPSIAGLQMKNLSVMSDAGYVMVKGELE